MKIDTIGFTKSSAGHFFTRLKKSKAARLVDVRLECLPDQWRDVEIVHL